MRYLNKKRNFLGELRLYRMYYDLLRARDYIGASEVYHLIKCIVLQLY